MKKTLIPLTLMSLVLAGCMGSLIPKKVELFQKKVQEFPEQSPALRELERQTIYQAHEKATETVVAALKTEAEPEVIAPAKETVKLTQAAVVSAGPPEKIPAITDTNLAERLESAVGKYNSKVDKFAKVQDKEAGKKIEGTGLFQIPYFLWAGGILVGVLVVGFILKTVLAGAAVANPGAAVGLNVVNAAQSVLAAGFSQVVKGGEDFKSWVEKEVTDSGLQSKILSAFQTTQMKAQDQNVQNVVAAMTK
jgi:hypothetical protein